MAAEASLIRNIISEVSRECKNYKISAGQEFITYYVKLLTLDPNRGLSEDVMKVREYIQHFIKFVVNELQQRDNPRIITLKLQNQLSEALKTIPDAVSKYKMEQEKKLVALYLGIIEPKDSPDSATLYKRIAEYTLLISRLGNPKQERVYKETYQAVQSVLNTDEIEAFPSLQQYIRHEVLESVVKVTSGVKLFNRYCHKGGLEIPDIPGLLGNAMEAVKITINDLIHYHELKSASLVKLICSSMVTKYMDDDNLVWELQKGFDEKGFIYTKEYLVAQKQMLSSLRQLLSELNNLETKMLDIYDEYINTLKTLKEMVIPSIHQSVDLLFPLFTYLCDLWMEMQDVVIELRELRQILTTQCGLLKQLNFDRNFENLDPSIVTPPSTLKLPQQDLHSVSALVHEFSGIHEIIRERNGAYVIRDEDFKIFIETQNKLEYQGYCCWCLVQSGGALIKGNPELCIIKYSGKFYTFKDVGAANAFTANPSYYVKKVIELTRTNVELIDLLQVENDLMKHIDIKCLVKPQMKKREVQNKAVEVDTHFEESYIDRSYMWNIWDHRRKAQKTVELLQCKTKSTMTIKNCYQSSCSTQTYDKKEVEIQAKKDNYTNTLQRRNYINGLRGRKDDKQCILELLPAEFAEIYKR